MQTGGSDRGRSGQINRRRRSASARTGIDFSWSAARGIQAPSWRKRTRARLVALRLNIRFIHRPAHCDALCSAKVRFESNSNDGLI